MVLDYNNIEINYNNIINVLTDLKNESKTFQEFEYRIKDDYIDGLTMRLYKLVASQYGKEYISQMPADERNLWANFIDYMLDNSNFLNKELKTRNKKHFDREAFYNTVQ